MSAIFLVWAPVAQAWSWPVQGPVLQGFSYDEAHPYAAGQHRGIDIGADAPGDPVVAPAGGTVSFAGSVPTSGECLTIETADGYSVTLTHLGSIGVAEGASVAEGDVVATIGPSGTPEESVPYVHLGIRLTSDPLGYLDPLGLLPAPAPAPTGSGTGSGSGAGSGSGIVVRTAPAASPAGGGLVVRSRPSLPSAPRVGPSAPVAPHATVGRPVPAVEVVRVSVQRPASEPVARTAPAPAPAPEIRRTRVAAPSLGPAGVALAAGPGILATIVALVVAFARWRRPAAPLGATVVSFPDEQPLRIAA